MKFIPAPLQGAYIIEAGPFADNRGWFARTYCKKEFAQIGHTKEWVQMNQSCTVHKGSVRGMHYQIQPFAEIKLVRCIAGSVFDVIIDIREGSPDFLKWFGIELSAANRKSLYIPEGFAHGFQTLENNTELVYSHSNFYNGESEGAVRYDDPAVGINWPIPITELSEKDQRHPFLNTEFKGIKI